MTTLWDTTGSAVVKELAAQRRTGGAVMSGVALTLVVIADEDRVAEAEQAAAAAAELHPCRLLIVVRRQVEAPLPRLDAEVLIGGRLGPGEAVVMRMYGRLGLHAESVVLPLLAADAPVVTWWHATPPTRITTDALGVIADRRITDCAMAADPLEALRARARDYAPGDTDLAWTRTTMWRATLTSTLDAVVGRRGAPVTVTGGRVEGDPASATAQLVAGWISSRCGCPIDVVAGQRTPGPSGVESVFLTLDQGEEVRVTADRKGGAVISQPHRADSVVALVERDLGELVGEELRRLDSDEPYSEALGAATGMTGLARRPGTREHVWFDPTAQQNGATAQPPATSADSAATPAPQVPQDSADADEVAQTGTHDADDPDGDREDSSDAHDPATVTS
ncbi:glucose-6-phosphate dehydrogenase [Modestobacter sp. I12A-02628]|uniref:Glucose-6-phosphate dehydrogenase assembly protein OpcA n=1 Tax=Goekera deserti TaxID=2497753 RepID=A0A7K3WDI7_9ACTN|nr:glucose-6-phosphate dehydrogenase assembly protein OpcA [Goekera deserti]MPQ96827.1 glucose-6-phosphate dehydrogenase [Goekera deserti]NDI46859.1 glucose-6-phosphate dehydrogenase [Goekera deserti]NEL54427.1 glucose-6-phosphate dehydrogenase assembly protein OpcA [Goekera deserti]